VLEMTYQLKLFIIFILLHFYLCFSVSGKESGNYKKENIASISQSNSSMDNTNAQIKLLSPFGGEYLLKETNINIKWDTSLKDKIEIKFSSDGGKKWSIIQSNIDSELGSIKWTIPDIQSTQCKIKICSHSENTNQVSSCNFTIGDQSILPGILIDEEFEDWNILSDIAQVTPGAASGKTLKAFNDDDFLYIYFETEKVLSLQNNNSITLYIDTDNDNNTGKSVSGIGAEIEFIFGKRRGTVYINDKKHSVGVGDLFLVLSPTVWSDKYEITLKLNSTIEDKQLFNSSLIRLLIKDESTSHAIPSENGGAGYKIGNYEFVPSKGYSILKQSDDFIRIISHNVEFSSFFRDDRKDSYKRLYQALQPDIIGFSELYQDYKLEDVTTRLEEILPSLQGKSWKARRTADNVLATRYLIKYNTSAGPFGNGAFLLDLRPKYNNDLLVIVAHPSCCDNDPSRQNEADAMAAFIRDAKAPGGELTLDDKTPVIIVGDMNFVGDPQQVTTMIKGDIVQEDKFGSDYIPDWDGTFFEDAKPLSSNLPHTFTHSGSGTPGTHSKGRLDYIFYSGSVLELKNSFVMFTPAIPKDTLLKFGLLENDSENASDHFPVIGDFSLSYEQHETALYESRENDNNGKPVNAGTIYTISGIVTATSKNIKDGFLFVQGNQAAIAIFDSEFLTQISKGDSVTMTGILSQINGMTCLFFNKEKSSLTIHSSTKIPDPRIVTISDINGQEWNGTEMLESMLVKIEDVQILSVGIFEGNKFYKISDGQDTMGIKIEDNTDFVNMAIPAQNVTLKGCLGQFKKSEPYDSGYYLQLGSRKDLEIIKEIEHVSIRTLRQNNKQGVPVYTDSVKAISGIITATNQLGRNGPAFIQDKEAGVGLYGSGYLTKIKMGDSITVTGPLMSYRGVTEYYYDAEICEVIVHKNVDTPEPQIVAISDILNQEWNGMELLEGKLLMLKNVEFIDQGVFEDYNNYRITDGTDSMNFRINNEGILSGYKIPKGKVTVSGIVTQNKSSEPFKGRYQLLPRFANDIKEKK
jgi:uncharacterized protein DUF5689/endonuclease/exonuclease/phosphatase family protein